MVEEAKALMKFAIEDFNKLHGKHLPIDADAFNTIAPLIGVLWDLVTVDVPIGEGCIVEINPDNLNTVFKMNLYALDVSTSDGKICDVIKQCKRISISHAGEFMFFEFEFMPIVRVS